jgi:hypothetical protein
VFVVHIDIKVLPSPFTDGRAPPVKVPPDPFTVPADFAFEPEFQNPVPRPIPAETKCGRHAQTNETTKMVCLTLAASFLLLAALPQIKDWAVYIIPLAYAHWIGLGFLAMWGLAVAWTFTERFAGLGPYRYIRIGIPVVARVLALAKSPTRITNGVITNYGTFVAFEYCDPHTGQLRISECRSRELTTLERGDYTTSFHVGDYVTAVSLPTKHGAASSRNRREKDSDCATVEKSPHR